MCDITDGEDFLLAASCKDFEVGALMGNMEELVIEGGSVRRSGAGSLV